MFGQWRATCSQDLDAARAQVSAAEQRAERAEADVARMRCRMPGALCIGDDVSLTPTPRPSWMQHSVPVTVPVTRQGYTCIGNVCVYDGDRVQP